MESLYKVCDIVYILPMKGKRRDYPYYYSEDMDDCVGMIGVIIYFEPIKYTYIKNRSFLCKKRFSFDPYIYHISLFGKRESYSWHSSMFCNINDSDYINLI